MESNTVWAQNYKYNCMIRCILHMRYVFEAISVRCAF